MFKILFCRAGRRAEFIELLDDRLGRERKYAYDYDDQKVGKYVARLIDKTVQSGVLSFGREYAEREPAGQEVHYESAKPRYRSAECETDLGEFFKRAHIFKRACKPHGGERQRIIE